MKRNFEINVETVTNWLAPYIYIYQLRGKTVFGIRDQLMKQINRRKVRKSINGRGREWGGGVGKVSIYPIHRAYKASVETARMISTVRKIIWRKFTRGKKKNAARARGKPDYAAWNKTEGSFNARLKAVGSVKLWIPVICIAADCRLNNAQPPFPHFFQPPFFLCRFSFFSSSFFFSTHYYLIQLSVLRDTFFNQRRIVEQNCTPIKSKWTRGQFA